MKASSLARAAAVVAVVGGVSLFGLSASAQAECKKNFVSGTSFGTFEYLTGVKARNAWRLKVRRYHGVGYTLWSKSKQRSTTCAKFQPGNKWRCVARAKPCR